MATYGSGQMLGSGINPESFKQDYSGFARAAEMQAQGLSNLGGSIAGVIKDYGQAKQERKKLDAGIKATVTGIESAIKMGDSLGIDVKSSLTPYLDKINDPNVTPTEAAAYAQEASSAIGNILNFGMKANQLGMEENQNIRAAMIKQAQMDAELNKPGSIEEIPVAGGTQKMVRNPQTGVFEPIKVAPLPTENNLVDLVKGFEGFKPNAYSDYKQTSIGYGTKGEKGEVINEEQATERLKSELSESAKRIERASALKGVSLNQNQLNSLASFDYNTGKGVDLIERFGDKPNELVAKMQEYTKAGGETLPGLERRRQIEAALFMTPVQSPVGFAPTKGSESATPSISEQIALAKYKDEQQKNQDEKAQGITAKSRTLKIIDKYMNADGTAKPVLDDTVGFGEGVGSFFGNIPFVPGGNSPETIANQKELQLNLLEASILEASKALKPVSVDEMKFLQTNRPKITDKTEVWTQYMKSIKDILGNPANYKQGAAAEETDPVRAASNRLSEMIRPK